MASSFGGGSGGSSNSNGLFSLSGDTVSRPVTEKKAKAAETFGDITRNQYQDWLSRFYPKQKELMDLASGQGLLTQQLSRVEKNNNNALAGARLATDNRMGRMGVSSATSPQDNSQGLRMALMTAGTENALREHEQERQFGILTGADAGIRDAIKTGGVS